MEVLADMGAEVEDLLLAHGIIDQADAVEPSVGSASEPVDDTDENEPLSRRDKTSLRM